MQPKPSNSSASAVNSAAAAFFSISVDVLSDAIYSICLRNSQVLSGVGCAPHLAFNHAPPARGLSPSATCSATTHVPAGVANSASWPYVSPRDAPMLKCVSQIVVEQREHGLVALPDMSSCLSKCILMQAGRKPERQEQFPSGGRFEAAPTMRPRKVLSEGPFRHPHDSSLRAKSVLAKEGYASSSERLARRSFSTTPHIRVNTTDTRFFSQYDAGWTIKRPEEPLLGRDAPPSATIFYPQLDPQIPRLPRFGRR